MAISRVRCRRSRFANVLTARAGLRPDTWASRKAEPDTGQGDVGWWLYRVKVTAGQTPKDARHKDGTVWVWDFEVQPPA